MQLNHLLDTFDEQFRHNRIEITYDHHKKQESILQDKYRLYVRVMYAKDVLLTEENTSDAYNGRYKNKDGEITRMDVGETKDCFAMLQISVPCGAYENPDDYTLECFYPNSYVMPDLNLAHEFEKTIIEYTKHVPFPIPVTIPDKILDAFKTDLEKTYAYRNAVSRLEEYIKNIETDDASDKLSWPRHRAKIEQLLEQIDTTTKEEDDDTEDDTE